MLGSPIAPITTADLFPFLSVTSTKTTTTTTTTTQRKAESVTTDCEGQQHGQQEQDDNDEGNTVVTITNPTRPDQTITLIGTAHLSEKSNDQVQRIIESLQPNIVMVETDPTRLERIGIASIEEIRGVDRITTCEDIELPTKPTKTMKDTGGLFGNLMEKINPIKLVQELLIQTFTKIARALLTNMYDEMGDRMNAKGGGEFLRAIQCAENCTTCHTLILGDRDSLITISRAAELAIENGNPFGVLNRLQQVNGEEMQQLEDNVRKELLLKKRKQPQQQSSDEEGRNNGDYDDDDELEEADVGVAIMEALKEDKNFRNRLFARLEQEVPEFTQAFLKERDYLMCESILRELEDCPGSIEGSSSSSEEVPPKAVVAVVGLAHVPGMEKHFNAVFANQPAPLIEELSRVVSS